SVFFFFSSRRRHTRWPRDWSSDVCSSDLDTKLRIVNAIVGGWAANGNVTFQSGPPLSFGNIIYFGGPLNLVNHPANTGSKTFDVTRFDMVSGEQPADNIRTFDTQFNNLRRDPTKNLDLSLLKRINLRERKYLQVRF